ncbi:MAG: pentapeptide repeat-containing protein [Spirochaetaceae bacterium]|jgi:uncharacterized protein YjbI with pentapeptide repeats|nr:pentapeptide repeat-containing protein [Spirochaetaceae bacterium]
MFEFKPCAAGCGNGAITGSNLCGLHCVDRDTESRRLAMYITERKELHNLCVSHLIFKNQDFSSREYYGCNFMESIFISCSFKKSRMRMTFFDMSIFNDCDFSNCDTQFLSFGGASLQSCAFQDSELVHLNFCGAMISNCEFSHSNLYNSRFNSTQINNTQIDDCNIKKVFFINSIMKNVSLKYSNTAEAVFEYENN